MTLMNRSSTLFLTSCGQPSYRKSNQRRFAPTSCPHHRNQVPTSLEYAPAEHLKEYVGALGGQPELRVIFLDGDIVIENLGPEKPTKKRRFRPRAAA